MLAKAPEVAVKEVVESGKVTGEAFLATVGRVAAVADEQIPGAVGIDPNQFGWRGADAVLCIDAAALYAADHVERALEDRHAKHALVEPAAVRSLVNHSLEDVRPLAFAGAATDLGALDTEGADVEMISEADHLENRLVVRIAEAEVADRLPAAVGRIAGFVDHRVR